MPRASPRAVNCIRRVTELRHSPHSPQASSHVPPTVAEPAPDWFLHQMRLLVGRVVTVPAASATKSLSSLWRWRRYPLQVLLLRRATEHGTSLVADEESGWAP